ncbi:3'(2'),5'-bisphosphate nucleotidase CysQ [Notoacmeibacter sp. MSK16QG-6]|uniref:3'(2'),5'-bisphosphate nucleotidase CysQ n=1 Tax=Notoacmeibacter sp. MSK16QG-6 TaxID=2957982 RepID=UPI00209E5A2B|nr:3'(2'),5'-bisphosphate nucleotidase CysQ [Notoacmeibacter sp. MSK16QG-6]MCP1198412.1 3'(2'),5'-bisphosphate nucleotidase CysQ [Notoacmeibacter sp. MSK16QG-6]
MDGRAGLYLMQSEAVLRLFERLAVEAGQAILSVRARGIDVERKGDESPVTEADRAGEAIILKGLDAEMPDVPVVAEESMADGRQPDISGGHFILVDPLDGTKEFIKGSGDFTVNIALVEQGVPTVGVVLAPARSLLWMGAPEGAALATVDMAKGEVQERRSISCQPPSSPLRVVASSSHRTTETDRFIAGYPGAQTVAVGSSLKFCLLAEGEADLYPRFGRTMEWDTAAGDAVLRAAGGVIRTPDGEPFLYGKIGQAEDCDFANGWFVCASAPELLRNMSRG